jgi:hypothetical protein
MNELTVRQLNNFKRKRIAIPEGYLDLNDAERRAFVEAEIQQGNLSEVEALSAKSLLYFGSELHIDSPEYFLYRILLAKMDPAEVADLVINDPDHMMFIQAFGLERALPHKTTESWLAVYRLCEVYGDPGGSTKAQIKLLLESRGVEAVASAVTTRGRWDGFIEIFGIRAARHVQKDVASKFKGWHLEDELGL